MLSEKDIFIGKTIIIGLTFLDNLNQEVEKAQLSGTISEINEEGIFIKLDEGDFYTLPPDLSAIQAAPPGEYEFESTGKVVVNPDYMTTWRIYKPDKNE